MRLSSFITDPLGRSARYSYNADDQLTSTTDRDGRRTTFSYDSGGRETGEAWLTCSGGVLLAMTFTYDNMGRVTSADSPSALLTNTYDSGGNQLTAVTSGPGTGQPSVTLSSAYDGNNNRTSLADSISTANTIAYAYDIPGRMTTISTNVGTGSYSIAFAYDPAGNLSSIARKAPTSGGGSGNFTTTTFSYDAADRLTTIADGWVNSGSGGGSAALATYAYGYDNANRVTSETDKEGLVTLSYDSGGQLLTARGSRTENYSYDSGGNRNMTGYTTGTGNELTSGGGYTFTYDNEGNMTGETQLSTGDGWTFGYDNRNRMVAAEEKSSGGTILCQATYTYDAENRRIGEDVNGTQTWTAYDGVNPYADFNGAGTLQDRYLMGAAVDEVLGRIDASGGVAWYLTDRLGSVRDIVNTTGTVLDHVVYDSFGDVTSETNASNGDRFKFTGREYDAATGMYYYRARYYDPATGRFAEQDPSGYSAGDSNLYRYVSNGPARSTDPSGTQETGGGLPDLPPDVFAPPTMPMPQPPPQQANPAPTADPPMPQPPPLQTTPMPTLSPSGWLSLKWNYALPGGDILPVLQYQKAIEAEQAMLAKMRAALDAGMTNMNYTEQQRNETLKEMEKIIDTYMTTSVPWYAPAIPADHCTLWTNAFIYKLMATADWRITVKTVTFRYNFYYYLPVHLAHSVVLVQLPGGQKFAMDDGWWGGVYEWKTINFTSWFYGVYPFEFAPGQ